MELRKITLLSLICILAACDGSNTDTNNNKDGLSDEVHRPIDWSAESNITMRMDTIHDWQPIDIASSDISTPYEELIHQLWKLAFSGEAKTYAPSILGELDPERPLSPKELVDHLVDYDTSFIENLETGNLEEIVTPIEFSEGTSSAIVLYVEATDDHGGIKVHTDAIGIGSKVFAEDGLYRGVKIEYFIDLEPEEQEWIPNAGQRISIESDSLGIFRLASITPMSSNGEPFLNLLFTPDSDSIIHRQIIWEFDYKRRRLNATIKDLQAS